MNPTATPPMDTVAILERLVAFDTTSSKPNEPIVDWIGAYLDRLHVPYKLSRGPEEGKFNLHAVLLPAGSDDASGGLAFSGHVDCVPVEGQAWSHDPFTLREHDGRLYARGAADMKGFVASMLSALPDLLALDLKCPVHLFITFDEEITCDGARYLIEDVIERGAVPDFCIVGEPTMMMPVIAHKGRLAVRVSVRGQPAHSSQPELGANALHAMGRAIGIVADEAERFAAKGRRVEGFEPPYTTMQVGLASGGSILNIVPEQASFDMEWRCVPGDRQDEILAKLQDAFAPLDRELKSKNEDNGFAYSVLTDLPPLAMSREHELTMLVQQATGSNTTGHVSYGTEAGIYQIAGLPTIVCGPGDIAQAHKPDEWIARSQLERCDRFIRDMVRQVCTSA